MIFARQKRRLCTYISLTQVYIVEKKKLLRIQRYLWEILKILSEKINLLCRVGVVAFVLVDRLTSSFHYCLFFTKSFRLVPVAFLVSLNHSQGFGKLGKKRCMVGLYFFNIGPRTFFLTYVVQKKFCDSWVAKDPT